VKRRYRRKKRRKGLVLTFPNGTEERYARWTKNAHLQKRRSCKTGLRMGKQLLGSLRYRGDGKGGRRGVQVGSAAKSGHIRKRFGINYDSLQEKEQGGCRGGNNQVKRGATALGKKDPKQEKEVTRKLVDPGLGTVLVVSLGLE